MTSATSFSATHQSMTLRPRRCERNSGRRPSGASRVAFAAAAKRAMILKDVVGHLVQERRPGLGLAPLLLDAGAPEVRADERRRPRHERRAHRRDAADLLPRLQPTDEVAQLASFGGRELGDQVGHEPLEVEALAMAGALGMLICLWTPGTRVTDARVTTGTRGTRLQFEAASCKGRVERLSGGSKSGERMATCPLITQRAVPMR